MGLLWTIPTVLFSCILMGEACRYSCVAENQCLQQAPLFDYRLMPCDFPKVCCESLKQKSVQEGNHLNSNETLRKDPSKPVYNGSQTSPNYPNGEANNTQCGMSNPNGLVRVQGITEDNAKPGQFPWAVAIFHKTSYLAGGSLIAPGVVLTVAHRMVDKLTTNLFIRAGDWDLNNVREPFNAEQRDVERITIHEGFNFSLGANNLALLFLQTPIKLSDPIRTICLPDPQKSFGGRRCMVAGWGKIKFQDQSFSSILKKVEVPMVDRNMCQQQLRKTSMGFDYQLPEKIICAGGEPNQDACIGDGGSALFCSIGGKDSDIYEQAGIVNWGIECGRENIPAIYTDLAIYRDWIWQHTFGLL
ncbi:phenoloxidase-activating factor 2-like [Drosophila eugracilis]|uniref:phenoloxidase-activating factor 2-like n=1 Tax=Drosophila eugracilis TaxID=29029 RepID=UPI0007E5E473|nr:phenoloxidase-activating factor 2-like [Drosophila eugracilis]